VPCSFENECFVLFSLKNDKSPLLGGAFAEVAINSKKSRQTFFKNPGDSRAEKDCSK